MGSIETLERSPRTRMGAYFYVVFMFAAAVFKTTAGLGELAGQDYLWRLFWIVAATGWALRTLCLADREPEALVTHSPQFGIRGAWAFWMTPGAVPNRPRLEV